MKRKEPGDCPGVVVLDPVVPRCKCSCCPICVEARVEKAFIFRDAIMSAVAWKKVDRLETLVSALIKFTPCRVSLARSGLGALVSDGGIWNGMDASATRVWAALKAKFSREVPDYESPSCKLMLVGKCTLVDLKSRVYSSAIESLQEWLLRLDVVPVQDHIARRVAVMLVNHGFTSWCHLDGVVMEDLVVDSMLPCDRALIVRAIVAAEALPKPGQSSLAISPIICDQLVRPVFESRTSALSSAESLHPDLIKKCEKDWLSSASTMGLAGLGS